MVAACKGKAVCREGGNHSQGEARVAEGIGRSMGSDFSIERIGGLCGCSFHWRATERIWESFFILVGGDARG
jgi:hypothetical protein